MLEAVPKPRSLLMGEVLLINPVSFYRFSPCQEEGGLGKGEEGGGVQGGGGKPVSLQHFLATSSPWVQEHGMAQQAVEPALL